MKKLFFILAISAFAACENGDTNNNAKDSSVNTIDSTADAMKDSVEGQSDTTKKMIDSSADAMKDSVKGKM